ncbi:hypothetical protein OTU49_016377 [Cherax quadricarinatus]|uniref:Uncharacterized protein n=2 Tax=Cherax quadricarinatus TaxID=27406 RepID=A0AAW0YC10_CHEQU
MKLKKLHSLNLNHNIIKELPTKMNEMHCLVNLHLSFNNITCISHQLFSGRLSHTLQMLDLSNNKIEYLPHTLGQLHSLVSLKLDGNILHKLPISLGKLTRLKLCPTAADIPATLVEYLQAWLKCLCGKICYESHILACITLNLQLVASGLVLGNVFQTTAPALATLCSQKCFDKFSKT